MSDQEQQKTLESTRVIRGVHDSVPTSNPEPEKQSPAKKKNRIKQSGTGSSVRLEIFHEGELLDEKINVATESLDEYRKGLTEPGSRYKIEKLLAMGGFGEIYLAEDRILGRKIVIKSLKEKFLKDESVATRFIAEAKLCAQLRHPSIIPIYALNKDRIDGLHIAMQLVKGITLKVYLQRTLDFLKTNKVSAHAYQKLLKDRLSLFLRICDAVSFSHDKKIIHNDLKPENIMIADFGQVYIMDWGIASEDGSVGKGGVPGTIFYMAPERISARVATQRTDIFSLGMILNEVVTLRGHIAETDTRKAISRICTGVFEPSTCILPKYRISAPLRAIIEKARCPNPAERYSTVRDLANDIRHYLFYEEVKACPDSFPLKVIRFFYRHKAVAFSFLLVLFLFLSGVAFMSYYSRNKTVYHLQQVMLADQRCQAEVEKLADGIANNLFMLREQSRSLSSTLKHEISQSGSDKKVGACHLSEEFKNYLPGLVHTAYFRNPVTLNYGVFFRFKQNVPETELQKWANCFHNLHGQMQSTIFVNADSDETSIRNDKNKLFHLRESLIRRIIFILGPHLAFCYPGMYDDMRSVSDFQSDYIQREFRSGRKLFWSSPFKDSSGVSVISCWQTLYDTKGHAFGSMGFEVNFRELLKRFAATVERNVLDVYSIVDKEDQVLYSTLSTGVFAGSAFAKEQQTFYRFPQLLRKIRRTDTPSFFSYTLNGYKCRIYWTRIRPVNWLLIRHVIESGPGFAAKKHEAVRSRSSARR